MKPLVRQFKRTLNAMDLERKIMLALLVATIIIGGAVTASSYFLARHELAKNTRELLATRAQIEQREIELRLASVVALAESLAQNSVTGNALADTQGRETYLAPLLRNQNLGISGSELTVVDYRGRIVASSLAQVYDYSQNAAFAAMMDDGLAKAQISNGEEGATLLVVLPVRYRLTSTVEGGVVLRVPLAPLLGSSDWADARWLADGHRHKLIGQEPSARAFELPANLLLPPPLDSLGLQLIIARDYSSAFQYLNTLLGIFVLIGLLTLVGLFFLARLGAYYIISPLREAASAAEEIAASGRPVARLPTWRRDEFGRLSAAFNTMVDRLRESYGELEGQVAERTRDYEESKEEAERVTRLLREAIQHVAVGFTIYDENDCLVDCNEAYLRFYEESRDLIVRGASFEEIVRRGAERGQYAAAIGQVDAWVKARVAQHQSADGVPIEQRLGDGRWLLIVEHRTPSAYIVGNRIDITDLKLAAQALKESEERYELSVRGANDGIWDWNPVTGEALFSERWKSMLGYTEDEIGRDIEEWRRLVHPDDLPAVLHLMQEHLAGKSEFYSAELRLRCKDGGYKWILCRGKALFDASGNPVRMSGSHTDITDRRIAEAHIRERNEQLDAIFALSPDAFVSFDGERRVRYISPAFRRMTGIDDAQVTGLDEKAFSDCLAAACIEQARFPGMATLRAQLAAETDAPGEASRNRRQLIEMAGAGKRVLEVGVRTAQAESVSQILYLRDVTHETVVDQMKSEFLSTAAHELRTPMACIYGFSELMLNNPEFSADERAEFLGAIYHQSELMISIINELLDLARIEARRGKDFEFVQVDACQLLQTVIGNFKAPNGRDAPLFAPCDTDLKVRADARKLTQAVNNVLSNAYKYSPGGGSVEVSLVTSADAAGTRPEGLPECLGIRVVDHGMGMSPEQLARVFERFYRADTSGKIPGTGLGMSIVREIVELHGGDIALASEAGCGTTVTLWIPLAAPALGTVTAPATHHGDFAI